MAFCVNCGQQLGEGAKFCTNCGQTVTTHKTENSERKTVYDANCIHYDFPLINFLISLLAAIASFLAITDAISSISALSMRLSK